MFLFYAEKQKIETFFIEYLEEMPHSTTFVLQYL